MKHYKIERRIVDVKKGWFKKDSKPMWCLVEYGVHTHDDYMLGSIDFDYNRVILKSEDLEYIKQEYDNFNGVL